MKTILKYVGRGLAVIGFIVVLVSASGWVILLTHKKPELAQKIILSFDLTKGAPEKVSDNPLRAALDDSSDLSLRDVVSALDLAAKDDRVKVVYSEVRDNGIPMASAQEIRDAVFRVREANKPTYAFATSFGEMGPSDKAYYLASSFQNIWMQPVGLVGLTGLGAEMPFARDALKKIGVQADVARRGKYKSLMESATDQDFSPANAEMMESLLDDLSAQLVGDISLERHIDPLTLARLIDVAPLTAQEALHTHLVDRIGYRDELEDLFAKAFGDDAKVVPAADYLAMRRDEIRAEDRKKKDKAELTTVAFIQASGNIVQSKSGGPLAGSSLLAADDLASAIRAAVDDDKVEAILLRLDTPGGSAVASETIRRALVLAGEAGLPIVVSMGSVAGSGGYWVASVADIVVAEPATLTGSIGVIAGKFSGTDVWDKLGISWGRITRGENADMWSITAPFTSAQKARIDQLVGAAYDDFKQRVAEGRNMTPEAVEAIAQGRVWTGNQAFDLGLVDELGGLTDAITITKNILGFTEDDFIVLKTFPAPENFRARIKKFLFQMGGTSASMGRLDVLLDALQPALERAETFLHVGQRDLRMPPVSLSGL
jgi:protease-4